VSETSDRFARVATPVVLLAAAFWTYVYVASEEPFCSFRTQEAIIALAYPTALLTTFVFWSVDTLRRTRSPVWLCVVLGAGALLLYLCASSFFGYADDLSRFECGG
jgi:hypothetical protein